MLSGLPGVGKTTVARRVSALLGAVHVRIDTIEAAMVVSGVISAAGGWDAAPEAGYRVAYALAEDFLRAGHLVIADSVNPIRITRDSWARVAAVTGALSIDVEVICSDTDRHRHRVTARTSDLDGLTVPTWEEVQSREFESWGSPVLRVDTALGAEPAAREIVAAINAGLREQGEVAAPTPQASESQAAEPSVG